MVLRLVSPGRVDPNVVHRIDIAGANVADFLRSHSGQLLKLDHRPHLSIQARSGLEHVFVSDWQNPLGFTSFGTAKLQAINRQQSVISAGRHQALLGCPAKHPANPAHSTVDRSTSKLFFDHRFANEFQLFRPELVSRCSHSTTNAAPLGRFDERAKVSSKPAPADVP
jgi:hypothetical protein